MPLDPEQPSNGTHGPTQMGIIQIQVRFNPDGTIQSKLGMADLHGGWETALDVLLLSMHQVRQKMKEAQEQAAQDEAKQVQIFKGLPPHLSP